ncbi:hypothetical protein NKR23_g8957 [Pleurostoma richardsiae]|uniref:Uncharacterized protein n=1 Tax=Pleurostoma richardsiae TaxID=41990 RepID=A0AA38VF60_9PEZI|nr:hypothetical protein NKR23_g8957 [Pleurostoma richardsiae]
MLRGAQARSVLSDIIRLKDGTLPLPKVKEQIERRLSYDQWLKLSHWIEYHAEDDLRNYWDTKLHFDYTCDPPGSGKNFVIRIPTAPHQVVLGAMTKEIFEWLKDVRENEEYNHGNETTIDIAHNITARNSTRVCLENGDDWEPDQSFKIKRTGQKKSHPYPAVVIEISYLQRYKNLEHRAETWIRFSNSNVRTVIGLDLNDVYKQNQSATVFVWKSRDGEPELLVKSQFRDESGRAIPDVDLCVSLSDFLQDDDVQENSRFVDPKMLISSKEIVMALEDGVEDQEIVKRSREEIKSRIEAQKSNR